MLEIGWFIVAIVFAYFLQVVLIPLLGAFIGIFAYGIPNLLYTSLISKKAKAGLR